MTCGNPGAVNQQASAEGDPILDRVAETSLRLMAGVVPKGTLTALQKKVQACASYPWEWVVDKILQGPMAPEHLVKQGLRAQRDWIIGAGRARPRKRLAVRSKTIFAWLLSRLIFSFSTPWRCVQC